MPLPPLVDPVPALSAGESARTARHRALAGLGDIGQRRLAAAHIAVIGAGGLGSPAILALVAAGVGSVTVIDDDIVEHTNLQRQVLHRLTDIGAAKVDSAVRVAEDLSPETVVHPVRERLTTGNAATLLRGAHLVIDGSDTFETRAAVAGACEELGIPLVWGVVQEFHAQVTVFWSAPPADTAAVRLRDLHRPDEVGDLPTCSAVGVLGALCLQVGGLLAAEAVKLVTGIGEPLLGRVAVIDALAGTQRDVPLRAATGAAADPPPADPAPAREEIPHVTAAEMLAAQEAGATLLDVREPFETATGIVGGSVLIPLADFLADPGQIDEGPVVVLCAHGIRALRAAEVLRGRGVAASVLAGGLAAWTPA